MKLNFKSINNSEINFVFYNLNKDEMEYLLLLKLFFQHFQAYIFV